MNEVNLGTLMQASIILLTLESTVLLAYLVAKGKLTGDRFKRFLGVFLIGTACSLLPMGPLSLIFGFPAVLLSSILVTSFLDKPKKND